MDYFNEYTSHYNLNDTKQSYKYYHSIRVMDNMEILAKSMSLPFKDIELAKCIGLLHDIGRFEQYKRFKSFDDFNLDHGDYGEKVLRETNALKNYDIDKSDYEVVYKAIRNHNKFKIEANLTNRELLFSKMIRDADKLDILFALGNKELKKVFEEDDSNISKKISDDFYQNKMIKRTKESTLNDEKVMLLAFTYDINFKTSLEIIKSKNYYNKIYERLKNKKIFKPYIDYINNYIDERTD